MNSSTPLISVVIPTYNRPTELSKAVQSVFDQTFNRFEIIIVDDCSSTPARSSLTRFTDPRMAIIRNSQNLGLAASRNKGIARSHSKYIAFLDDDDLWLPQKLQLQYELLVSKDKHYAVVYCGQKVLRAAGGNYLNNPIIKGRISDQIIKNGLSTISSSGLFTKVSLLKVGGFDTNLKNNIDHDIWMSLAHHNYWADYVNQPLTLAYEQPRDRMTSNLDVRLTSLTNYLAKWSDTYITWFGKKGAENYKKRYSNYVVGWLAREQFKRGQVTSGLTCLRLFNRDSLTDYLSLISITFKCVIYLILSKV